MKYCIYFCSKNIASQVGVSSEYILHNHGIYNHKKHVYIFPLANNNTTINPEVFTKIKNELNLKDLLLVESFESYPLIAEYKIAQSLAVFASGPP